MSPIKWTIFEWDENTQTNNQRNKTFYDQTILVIVFVNLEDLDMKFSRYLSHSMWQAEKFSLPIGRNRRMYV